MKKPSQILPEYVGDPLPIQPPFYFRNMTACVFPLRAKLTDMQRFCDGYLNIIPKELGYFRASIPYVHLMMLDYGKLAIQAANMGWFAQREVMFSVPVEWYKWQNGRYVFCDWASVAAFIYVDDPMSMKLGRTLMGWPKVLVRLDGAETGWMNDPAGKTTDATLSADVFAEAYAGNALERRPFLEVKSSLLTPFKVPGVASSPVAPWTVWSNVMQGVEDLSFDTAELMRGLGVMPKHQAASGENYGRMMQLMMKKGNPWHPDYSANTINLKQFRSAANPEHYCYQALTNGPMHFTAFNRAAFLGETSILAGDTSGGFEISLARWPSMPIIETLGLETHSSTRLDGVEVCTLKPFMPLWYDVDMSYTQASRIAWRTERGPWRNHESTLRFPSEDKLFNTTIGAGLQVFTGPYRFTDASLRVLPLIAERRKMQEAVDRAVNQALGKAFDDADFFEDAGEDTLGFVNEIRSNENFQVWTPPVAEGEADSGFAHVYLVFQDWGKVSSETDDFGDWATRTATFYVPVQHMVGGRCVRVGLVPIVTLSEGTAQTCTLTELYGIQATEASFEEPRLEWYPPQPGAPRNLMSVKTMVLPSLGRGERTRKREILKVHYLKPDKQEVEKCKRCSAEADSDDSKEATQQMADALPDASELGANVPTADNGLPQDLYAEAFGAVDRGPTERPPMRRCQQAAAEVLALFRSISVYTLKQFRDEATPERACYQALLRIPWTMQKLRSVIVQKGKIQIKIADFPSLPIVSQLGLLPVKVEGGEGATVYTVEAVDAFTVQGDLRLGNAEELRTRVSAGRFAWRINKDRSPAAPPVASGDYGPILQRLEHASNDQLDEFRREVREGVLEHHGVSAAIKGSKPPPPNFDGVGDSNNSYLPALRSYGPQEILRSLLGRNPDTVPTIVATQLHGGADS